MNISDTIDGAKKSFQIAGRGCVIRIGEDEPYAETKVLFTAVSEAVERYDPSREAAILLETASGYQVLILSPEGYNYVGGLDFRPSV